MPSSCLRQGVARAPERARVLLPAGQALAVRAAVAPGWSGARARDRQLALVQQQLPHRRRRHKRSVLRFPGLPSPYE